MIIFFSIKVLKNNLPHKNKLTEARNWFIPSRSVGQFRGGTTEAFISCKSRGITDTHILVSLVLRWQQLEKPFWSTRPDISDSK